MTKGPFQSIKRLIFSLLLVLLAGGCTGASTSGAGVLSAWIDVPVDGLVVPAGQALQIEGRASGSQGVEQVEIWINGELAATIEARAGNGELAVYSYNWTPPQPGDYTIQTVALGSGNTASEPDTARVTVPGEAAGQPEPDASATPTFTLTPTLTAAPETPTPTFTAIPEPVIEFWGEPLEIDAGECMTLHWHVENVQQVIFGGIQQPFDGSYSDCIGQTQTYPLTVVLLDGTQEKRSITIQVRPPPPSADTAAPPAPAPYKPGNGATLGCVSSTTVMWQAVTDPSGISQYQLQAERHAGDHNWQTAAGSVWSGLSGTSTSILVECGWTYRWRVRAVDGAGNTSAWSGWFEFSIPLT